MNLKIVNYDRNNMSHITWAIALTDCSFYLIDEGATLQEALSKLGIEDEQIERYPEQGLICVDLLELSEEQREWLVAEKVRMKGIRRGA